MTSSAHGWWCWVKHFPLYIVGWSSNSTSSWTPVIFWSSPPSHLMRRTGFPTFISPVTVMHRFVWRRGRIVSSTWIHCCLGVESHSLMYTALVSFVLLTIQKNISSGDPCQRYPSSQYNRRRKLSVLGGVCFSDFPKPIAFDTLLDIRLTFGWGGLAIGSKISASWW